MLTYYLQYAPVHADKSGATYLASGSRLFADIQFRAEIVTIGGAWDILLVEGNWIDELVEFRAILRVAINGNEDDFISYS